MKICLDARFKVKSGASSYVINLIPAMLRQKSGHAFILLKYPSQHFDFEQDMDLVVETPESDLAYVLWTYFVLPFKLRQWNADVYHSLKMPGPYWMGAKTVNTMHSIFKPYKGSFPVSMKTRIYTFLFVNGMIRKSHRLIAVSDFASECLQDVYGVEAGKIDTIYHGIGAEFDKRPAAEVAKYLEKNNLPENYIMCVGNVFPVKNHLTAVRAFAQASIPEDTHLLIAGDTSTEYAEC